MTRLCLRLFLAFPRVIWSSARLICEQLPVRTGVADVNAGAFAIMVES